MTPDKTETEKLISPASIGHFGIRTTPDKFEAMVNWHLNFFGGRAVLRNKHAAFIAWDDEHHRMVIVSDPSHEQIKNRATAATVYHIAFTLNSLADLATSYEQKKARGILPHWPVNHGMSTSMYYSDPDGNEFEMQVNNFDTSEEALAFMATPEYLENPIGVDLDIDEWLKRVRSGEDEATLKKRPVIGQRLSRYENTICFKKPAATTA
ncbi:Glyoxalase/Bleomycin resistance protein/Dihydroxybiphenyl dioxygenase [Sordaria brevicollis]|uniref:Glyoxalase/Bleomycin resistance protein/Dihydroxybiphenyl dioxygenase n=1 Tax=Sordaria brevicollis TaxID=83679 RepID=A0AAE0PMQ6_SORBR|nr:Glyoxalase/Bleomycin resistance protein/Dihydroxybiphenyl dioxygenase [Sordaria brevicollis]